MDFLTAFAEIDSGDSVENAFQAVASIKEKLGGFSAASLIFFASPDTYDPETLATEFHKAFPNIPTFGCSSAGELSDGMMLWQSVSVMAFSENVFAELYITAAENMDNNPNVADELLADIERQSGLRLQDLNPHKYIGFVLMDGLSISGVDVMERIGELTDILPIGGYAGDERVFRRTVVFLNGKAYDNGVLYALMRPNGKWSVLKTQSIEATGKSMIATKVDMERHIIHEFDGQPAVRVYAEAMGLTPEQIPEDLWASDYGKSSVQVYADSINSKIHRKQESSMPDFFINWPLAVTVGGEPFVRAAITIVPGGGLQMYMPPIEGIRYHLYRSIDVVEETRRAIEEKRKELGSIQAVVAVSCLLREIQVVSEGLSAEYGALFRDFPYAGFSSYGEVYVSPVNQTAVMLVFA